MNLKELKELRDKTHLMLGSSEMIEIDTNEPNIYFNKLRELGFYRVYETYFKDEDDCREIYCTGFLNSETGYEFLIALTDDSYAGLDDDINENTDISNLQFDIYVVLKGDSQYDRLEEKIFTGTPQEALEYTKNFEQNGYDKAKIHKPFYSK